VRDLPGEAEGFTEQKISEHLQGLTFPVTKEQIIAHMKQKNAPGAVIDQLNKLPDRTYHSATDLAEQSAKSLV